MKLSSSYVEMLNSGINRPADDGARAYPTASMEITLLDQAQQKAHRREALRFGDLCLDLGWEMSRQQQNVYLRQLREGYTLILTDTNKIIRWASHSFLRMTGYRVADAIGQRPSMLQGPDTDPVVTQRIREQLARAESVRADLLNYRKDGTTYTCQVAIDPIRNIQGELTHFLATEREEHRRATGLKAGPLLRA